MENLTVLSYLSNQEESATTDNPGDQAQTELIEVLQDIKEISQANYAVDYFFVTVFFACVVIYIIFRPIMYFMDR